jgi:putative copper resistance protein D
MLADFLMSGLPFFRPLMGVDPAAHRPSHVPRMLEPFIGMPCHAFFGIAVMMPGTLIAAAAMGASGMRRPVPLSGHGMRASRLFCIMQNQGGDR